MLLHQVTNFDAAYANGVNIVGGDGWMQRWIDGAAAFRAALPAERFRLGIPYGDGPRQFYDLFLPEGPSRGLVVYVHGGYWMRNDSSMGSHLAAGALQRGFAMAIPTYRLCPDARIAEIGVDVARAIEDAAREVGGPIHLTGHSAGGQLVSRMITTTTPLTPETLARIDRVVSVAGVHDLRPMLRTSMNETLRLDEAQARAESPALLEPIAGARWIGWVGGAERAEFRRQNALLANVWTGLGAAVFAYEAADKHHFNVIEDLADANSGLMEALVGA